MAAITPFHPIQEQFPSYALAERGIPLEMITSIQQEIEEILSVASLLNEDNVIAMIMRYTFLQEHLGQLAHPEFWSGRSNNRPSRKNRQLSRVEILEMTLLELKRFEERRVFIRAKAIITHPGYPGSYEDQVPEHPGIKELEDILASAIDREKNKRRDNLCIVDRSPGLNHNEMLAIQRIGMGYQGYILRKKGTHPLSVTNSDNLQRNSRLTVGLDYHPLFLDENNQPIRGTAITFHTGAVTLEKGSISKAEQINGKETPKQIVVAYHTNLGSKQPLHTFSFVVRTNEQGKLRCGYAFSPLDAQLVSRDPLPEAYVECINKMAQESKALVAAFHKQAPEAQAEDQCILLAFPTSRKDWDYLNQQFLLTLIHNIESKESSEEEREQSLYLLQHYIDQVELELPAKEGEEGETREMTPKEVYGAILKLLPKEQPVEKLDPRLLEEDKQKARAFKPESKKALAVAEGEAKEEPPSAAEAPLLLSDRQKEVIEEIYYDGKPKKAKAFFDFMRALLGQQEGVWFSQKGSHFTAHRKGKVSVTLVRPHGRDATARGSLKHQRNVLRQWMGWDQGNHPASLM